VTVLVCTVHEEAEEIKAIHTIHDSVAWTHPISCESTCVIVLATVPHAGKRSQMRFRIYSDMDHIGNSFDDLDSV
jgi:hypothetical protein